MEKENLNERKGKEPMKKSSSAEKPQESFTGASFIDYLTEHMAVSKTMVAALLDVTERTLLNWSSMSEDELSKTGSKSKRLIALYDFVVKAQHLKVPKSAMVSLLQEVIVPEDEHSNTPMFFIIEEPENSCFKSMSNQIISNFLKS